MSVSSNLAEVDDGDYPPYWDFALDGAELTTTFKQFNQANVGGRNVTILVGDIDGRDRSVFLWPEGGLYGRFRDHIRARAKKRIGRGERIWIRRGEKRPSKTTEGRQVWDWKTKFLDAPEHSQSDMFELYDASTDKPETDEPEEDESIPL